MFSTHQHFKLKGTTQARGKGSSAVFPVLKGGHVIQCFSHVRKKSTEGQ